MPRRLSVRGSDFIQGSIYRDNFMAVWENRFHDMRKRDWARQGDCRNCRHWKKCMGNGMHLHLDKQSGILHCSYARLREGENHYLRKAGRGTHKL